MRFWHAAEISPLHSRTAKFTSANEQHRRIVRFNGFANNRRCAVNDWTRRLLLLLPFVFPNGAFAQSTPPIGSLDAVTDTYNAGWAIDPDWPGGIPIHIYVDGYFSNTRVQKNSGRMSAGMPFMSFILAMVAAH